MWTQNRWIHLISSSTTGDVEELCSEVDVPWRSSWLLYRWWHGCLVDWNGRKRRWSQTLRFGFLIFMMIRPLIISIYDNMNELLRLHSSYLPIENMYELHEILFSAPQTLNPARMMPMRRMRDKNCLGNSAGSPPLSPAQPPTNQPTGGATDRCGPEVSSGVLRTEQVPQQLVQIWGWDLFPIKKTWSQKPALLIVEVWFF